MILYDGGANSDGGQEVEIEGRVLSAKCSEESILYRFRTSSKMSETLLASKYPIYEVVASDKDMSVKVLIHPGHLEVEEFRMDQSPS